MENLYLELFNRQKNNQFKVGNTTYKERLKKLKSLRYAVEVTYKQKIREALYNDFKKPELEVDLTEIYPVVSEIKYVSANLKSWMKRQKVETPMALLGSSSWVTYEPKGVCLIISPWNFPFNLTFGPLVSAIAAGNTVILKPSEMTPNSSKVMAEIVKAIFTEDEVALVEGAVETSKALLQLPFNHIFFTGSPAVGKIVMKAAATHLSSVTLELGGKSPTIVDKTANINQAARKIAWGKFLNNGQICVSPDYILIDETVKSDFISAFKKHLNEFYTEEIEQSSDYSRVVNDKHFDRLVNHIENARQCNASIEIGGVSNKTENFIEPTVISNLPEEASLLQEEIFGPILPIKTYGNLEAAIAYINSKEKPLALYIYSKSKSHINYVIKNTRAGTTAINNNVLQYSNHHLPFGGSNNSGIGKSHGFYGFEAFSNRRAVLKQHTKGATEFLFPPYTKLKQKLVDWTIKWF
ncbi:aldehyde dehydrogenase family protein [Mangrovimonas cancribranchiae]|uniref:Aldehyde dehydrogenase n=1 Tax=Mangrovimonas cancribranchiae TaxID=3080055 RepID=A0AAU6NWT4_9FLAO